MREKAFECKVLSMGATKGKRGGVMEARLSRRADRVKTLAFQSARANRTDIRFDGPEKDRRYAWRLVVLNADVIDLSAFSREIWPCSVFLRACRESSDSSRLDVYIPVNDGLAYFITALCMWALSAASFFAFGYTLGNRK